MNRRRNLEQGTLYNLAMKLLATLCVLLLSLQSAPPPATLPDVAAAQLARSLAAATTPGLHVWRDPAPLNPDGTVNAYVEIRRGERRKWELDIAANKRIVDRVMPASVGGYPVNYGFVPQTVLYDGDPFDALVLGPPIEGGTAVAGIAVGIMHMEDEKGLDSKIVVCRRAARTGVRGINSRTPTSPAWAAILPTTRSTSPASSRR